LASIFSAVIYLRLIRLILFNKYNNIFLFKPITINFSILIAVLVLMNLVFLVYPSEFFRPFYVIIINLFKTVFIVDLIY